MPVVEIGRPPGRHSRRSCRGSRPRDFPDDLQALEFVHGKMTVQYDLGTVDPVKRPYGAQALHRDIVIYVVVVCFFFGLLKIKGLLVRLFVHLEKSTCRWREISGEPHCDMMEALL